MDKDTSFATKYHNVLKKAADMDSDRRQIVFGDDIIMLYDLITKLTPVEVIDKYNDWKSKHKDLKLYMKVKDRKSGDVGYIIKINYSTPYKAKLCYVLTTQSDIIMVYDYEIEKLSDPDENLKRAIEGLA